MTHPRNTSGTTGRTSRHPVQIAALAVGVVFLLVGVLGFVPGVTENAGDIELSGHESPALLLGIFQVSILHNVVHLLFGIAGVALARSFSGSRGYLVGGGVVYLLLWVYGLVVDKESAANFVPLNAADDWLHLALGLGMVALGLILGRRAPARATDDHTGTHTAGRTGSAAERPGPGADGPPVRG
ncbi:DUF4383 domain-containing protein [Ornithinimicrobium sediminis]|uniref:DUF4383 domain-containing protein n=1 Tax=Ornithinimicrobium sediminis TaxID=2904603 RepID=UPI001E39D69E|nr:DUF4383 domain-containing protein [Ornithinimicrobium sediminis]MCE0487926.1 DUF4383 domain-containing protein [Ornithinimicrobium sediminis]